MKTKPCDLGNRLILMISLTVCETKSLCDLVSNAIIGDL